MSDIVKEAVRAYHRMIDIVENDQRNRAANLMAPSEIVNTEPNPEKVQAPQTEKVCSVIEITDTDDDNEDQEVRPIQTRSKSMSVVERKKRQFHQLEQQVVEKQTSEPTLQNVKKKRVDNVNASILRNSQSFEAQKQVPSSQQRYIIHNREDNIDSDRLELIECGRFIEQPKDMIRIIYMLMRRFAKLEKPNGGSFYGLSSGIRLKNNGDCLQKANCYSLYKHKCPVKLVIDYKHEDSVYKIYKSGTHNHDLNHVETLRSKQMDTFEDIKIEIISSNIADYVKEENNE